MELRSLLREEFILPGLGASEKFDAIEELLDFLVKKGALDPVNRDEALHALHEREQSMSTGMEGGVALPHATVDFIDDLVCALGIHYRGLEFESVDHGPAHLIILMLVPTDRFREHVGALAGIARLMQGGRLRERLRKARSPKEAMNIIIEEEPKA